ncbi:DUF3093 domain-containing protein [Microbacterium sp. R86528]|uniref:DUF3093 domain-containing protein n=1 Tax=Microbacterium sp. R86528 TaxID=3093864 RepID=UPI0037C9EB37
MQNSTSSAGVGDYRERLGPSLWVLVSAGVVAPMAALVFAPLNTTLALVIGAALGLLTVVLLVSLAPVVSVENDVLRAGRAHISTELLGEPEVHSGESARHARGTGLDPRAWHLIRGGIDAVVVVPNLDPEDPAPAWVICSRTPERLAAAIRRAQLTRSTPGR